MQAKDRSFDCILEDASSDSQIDHLRGAPDDLNSLIEAAAEEFITKPGKITCGQPKTNLEDVTKECHGLNNAQVSYQKGQNYSVGFSN